MAADDALSPLEFCQLQRQLVARMAMRKKRNVQMAPMQAIKVALCEWIEAADPEATGFGAALAEAVIAVSADAGRASGPHGTGSYGTGPAQAVASDLQMDWQMACTSPGFVAWLRQAATADTDDTSQHRRSSSPTASSTYSDIRSTTLRKPSPNG